MFLKNFTVIDRVYSIMQPVQHVASVNKVPTTWQRLMHTVAYRVSAWVIPASVPVRLTFAHRLPSVRYFYVSVNFTVFIQQHSEAIVNELCLTTRRRFTRDQKLCSYK